MGIIILTRMVVGDAENIKIFIVIYFINSIIAVIEMIFVCDVDLVNIGIIIDDVGVDT